jgi:hypothetical protein
MRNETKVRGIRLLLAPVIGLSLTARCYASGWLLFPFGLLVYAIISLFHCRFHYRAVRGTEPISWPTMGAIALSHILFISAFLLQYDYGDGPGWLTITLLLKGFGEDPIQGTLWGQHPLLMNLFVFTPVFISWYPLKRDREDDSRER